MRGAVTALAASAVIVCGAPAGAGEISGSARVFGGPVETDGDEEDQLDQRYRLNLAQQLAPFLNLQLSYTHNEFKSSPEGAEAFERRVREPRLQLVYDRSRFSARFQFLDRDTTGTSEADRLEVESLLANLDWRPEKGPRWSLRYQDQTNVADTAVFGRDTANRDLNLTAFYDRRNWNARYSFRDSELENRRLGFALEQQQHELRGSFSKRFWADKASLSTSGWIRDVEQTQSRADGVEFGRVLPPRQGLFAIDTSPEVGELATVADLVDGDTETATSPRIEIGGANVFRNIGVDLGVSRPVTRLEISVDSPSGPVIWSVFHSPDNLTWEAVASVVSEFDAAQLRYDLWIGETTDRFFKAVNVTANSFSEVAVTEIRALVETDEIGRREGSATAYLGDVQVSVNPSERFSIVVAGGARSDEDVAGGLLSRDFNETYYNALIRFGVTEDIDLRVTYRFNEIDENLEPVLRREEEVRSASLSWDPMETVSLVMTATNREERDDGTLLRSIDLVRLRSLLQLLPTLRLTSEVSRSDVDDPFSGFRQSSVRVRQTFEARPTERWRLEGSLTHTEYDSTGNTTITRRSNYHLGTTWSVTPYLTVGGDWDVAEDDRVETTTQRYRLNWSPGRRLTASLTYLDTDSEEIRRTLSTAAALSYRLNRWFTLWVNLSRSEFEELGEADSEITTARTGFQLYF